MNEPTNLSRHSRARGAAAVNTVIILAIVVVVAVVAYLLILRPYMASSQAEQQSVAEQGPRSAATTAGPSESEVESMSTSELSAQAEKAVSQQRWLAPKGNNAVALYLKVLDRDPDNSGANTALREIFQTAVGAAEQVINAGRFDEAERQIGLLAKAEPDDYRVSILRSKLSARRKVKREEKEAEEAARAKAVARAKAEKKARAQKLAKQEKARKAAKKKKEAQKRQKAEREKTQQQAVAGNGQNDQTSGDNGSQANTMTRIEDAKLVNRVQPQYPVSAARMNREGWVNVRFTVGIRGGVRNVEVMDSKPSHTFDRAALEAIKQWKFQPATRNGNPMATVQTRHIVFQLQ